MTLPKIINIGAWREGHIQGIAVDTVNGYIYYSFTTVLLKINMQGRPIGSGIIARTGWDPSSRYAGSFRHAYACHLPLGGRLI